MSAQSINDESISIDLSGLEMNEAIKLITDSTGYYFAYAQDLADRLNRDVLKSYENVSLRYLLLQLTLSTNVEFLLLQDQIVLRERQIIRHSEYLVGRVADAETGRKIPYATIELKGKNKGVVSNYEAKFKFNVEMASNADTLLVSSVGYQQKKIAFYE